MGDNPTMPAIRPVAIAVVAALLSLPALAWTQTPAPEAPPAAVTPAPTPGIDASTPAPVASSTQLANNVLISTIVKLRLRPRIAARVEQVVNMLNQTFELKGNYYKDTGYRVRLQLDFQGAGNGNSTMLQVCDGKTRWEYQKVLGMGNYRKLDITPILKKLEDPEIDEEFRGQVLTQLGFGGPEALMTGFVGAVAFDQFAEQDVDGVPSYILGGKWKDRNGLFGPGERPLAPTAALPPYVPANIQVYVNKEQLWPYKIEMKGNAPSMLEEDPREIDPITKRPIGVRRPQPKVDPTNITLRYTLLPESEIKPDEQFVFAAPRDASNLFDETKDFLQQLDKVIQFKLDEKKAKEAASESAGEPTIKTMPPMELGSPPPPSIGTPPADSPVPPK